MRAHHQPHHDRAQYMSDPERLVGYAFLDEHSTRLWRESRRWWAVRWLRRWWRERRRPAIFFR